MRNIGSIALEEHAHRLSSYLKSIGIDNQPQVDSNGDWAIWVYEDIQIEPARSAMERFRSDPDARLYHEAVPPPEKPSPKRQQYIDVRQTIFQRPGKIKDIGHVTLAFAALSIVVTLLQSIIPNNIIPTILHYSKYMGHDFVEIRNGQIWRLFTPIFLHFGLMHILFNVMWLVSLGRMIENNENSRFLLTMILIIAVFSNTVQYVLVSAAFGGMSGVVYGLFGYIWMRQKFESNSRYYLDQTSIVLMMIFFVLSFTGILGHVANAVHTAGLLSGCAWGYFQATRKNRL